MPFLLLFLISFYKVYPFDYIHTKFYYLNRVYRLFFQH
uniref:Uncharacterized protein n=1 Tax=Rhizophora mucronata TaxID=61149 RepID=A0A2P2KR16_RHIMU